MRRSIFSGLVIAIALTNMSMAALVQWKTEDGGNGHYYEAITLPGLTFSDAETLAESQGAYLLTITSQAEQDFISEHVIANGYRYRIGGFQPEGSPEPDGGWEWITGEPFTYTNWHRGEPNNDISLGLAGEDSLVLWIGNQWNDGPGNYRGYEGYVLEMVPQPATILILGFWAALARNRWHENL